VGLAHYGTALVQWHVVHSHERCLAWSMIDNEFEVCFIELLISVVLAKRSRHSVPVRIYLSVQYPGDSDEITRYVVLYVRAGFEALCIMAHVHIFP
jgi:hypothetical protein